MLHVAVQRFRHLVRRDVYLDITVWKPTRDLLADNHIIGIRTLLEQLEATIDGVVIGDADEIHATLASHAVDIGRPRVAIAGTKEGQRTALPGVAGMDVEISA
jgi:hypothetical protein